MQIHRDISDRLRGLSEATPAIVLTGVMLTVLTLILFAEDGLARRPKLWRGLRLGFLAATFLVLGMGLNGQLSVVQVVAFLHSLLTGFRWETFLVEPVIFMPAGPFASKLAEATSPVRASFACARGSAPRTRPTATMLAKFRRM